MGVPGRPGDLLCRDPVLSDRQRHANLASRLEFAGRAELGLVGRITSKLWNDPVFWQVFRNTFVYLILGTPISLVISFTGGLPPRQDAVHARLHPDALLPAVHDQRRGDGLGLAVVLSAGADRAFQQLPGAVWHPADRVSALDDQRPARDPCARRLGRARLSDHHLHGGPARHSAKLITRLRGSTASRKLRRPL